MSGLFVWIILGIVIYMLISRRGGMGGMGCCGGHHDHHSNHPTTGDPTVSGRHPGEREQDVIDLGKEDYKVLS